MAEKEEGENLATEDVKPDESSSIPCEEAPISLETVPAETPVQRTDSIPAAPAKDQAKINILLKAAGNAPIMKTKKWTVPPDREIGKISNFIKKYLELAPSERLFLYVNQTFAPAPDQTVKNLYDCYGANGNLTIHYCKSPAWG